MIRTALIPTKTLAAALVCAAKQEVHFYLNGVHVEPLPDGTVAVVATDGHVLYASKTSVPSESPLGSPLIIPREAVELVLAANRLKQARWPSIVLAVDGTGITLQDTVRCLPVDAQFVDWRKTLPRAAPLKVVPTLAPGILAQVERSRRAIYGNDNGYATLYAANDHSAGLMVRGDHLWLAMPMRDGKRPELPAWVGGAA